MKRVNFKAFVVAAIFICFVGTSMAQSEADKKEAIRYAESFDLKSAVSVDSLCSVTFEKGISIVSIDVVVRSGEGIASIEKFSWSGKDLDRSDHIIIPSGRYIVHLQYYFKGRYYLGFLAVTVESGKYYKVGVRDNPESEKTPYTSFIEPLTDPELLLQARTGLEKHKRFLLFQGQNPTLLQGKYSCEKQRAFNTFFIQYTFEGNKFRYEAKSKQDKMRPYVAEGRLFYSENIIVFLPEKAWDNGKEIKNFDKEPAYIWYYTMIDDVLHLETGRSKLSSLTMKPGIAELYYNGTLKKVSE